MGEYSLYKFVGSENPNFECMVCKSKDVWYRKWESSDGAYIDLNYQCRGCGREWWFEGADY